METYIESKDWMNLDEYRNSHAFSISIAVCYRPYPKQSRGNHL